MGTLEERSAAGDEAARAPARGASLLLYNLCAWPFFATHTVGSFALAWAISVTGDREHVFAVQTFRWARRNMKIGRFGLRLEGRPPEGGAVLVSNHRRRSG